MAKTLLTLKGQPSNMGASQLFDSTEDLQEFIKQHGSDGSNLLPNAKIQGKTLTFDGGSGTIETKANDFQN